MKSIFVSIVFICAWKFSSCCEENWYNKCKSNGECCSGNCDKQPEWEHGICKPAVTQPNETGGKCEDDWFNQCRGNSHCCSGFCDKDETWEFGVCKPKPEPVKPKCENDGFNECAENQRCCSEFCDKPKDSKYGICKPKSEEKPKCEINWFNECVDNQQCCSEFCDKQNDHKFGVCKPKPAPEPEPTKCEDDWFNKCTLNKHCCSDFCDKEPSWEFGVCKPPKQITGPGDGQCLQKNDIGCKDKKCCDNLICSYGPDNDWIQGLCTDHEITPPSKDPNEPDAEDDEEDDLSYYKRFVQDRLFAKNDHVFESKPLKCREIDVKGQFFFNYNETHSFRICDTCAEFPFEKLKDVRISDPPRENISQVPFNECFTACVSEEYCVALTYDDDYHTCYLFDSIQGNYDDDEYGWTTVILTQPIFVLKDYALSRHTETLCDGEPNFQYQTNDILKCFNHCEKHNCYVSTFHENSCKIYMEEKKCKNMYYKNGYYSLMHRDFFHDGNEWRFTEIVKDGSDEDDLEEEILYQTALESQKGNLEGPKVNPQLSNLTFLENRRVQREKFLHMCFSNCMDSELCTGVFVNFNEFVCRISDWASLKRRGHEEKGFNEYKLVHKKRDNVLYGYDENVDITFNRIIYNEQFKLGHIKECVQKCNQYDHCVDIYYNTDDNTCLVVGEFPKKSMTIQDPKKWINFRNNRIGFNQEQFRFARVGKNQYLASNFDKYLLESVRIDTKPANFESASEKCFNTCNRHSQDCQFVQISRSENYLECKLYKDIPGSEDRRYEARISSDLFARFIDAKFDVNYINQESAFNEFDAVSCKPDAESIARDADYLYRNNDKSIQATTPRSKRGIKDFFKKVGKFFKKVGEAIIETPKKIVQTGINIVKSIDKAVKGDKKGALETFREAPLVKSAENLYHDVKKVGEGVIKGDWKKVGEGALGVVTNDFVDFIPGGGGKIIKIAGKGVKGAIKGGADKAKDKAKKDIKKDKKEITDKNKRKNDEKQKKDKEEKEKKCNKKRQRRAAPAAGQKRKRNDCDNDCEKPDAPKGSRGKLLPKTLDSCNNVKPKTKCNYLCNAGYSEEPYTITCKDDGKWTQSVGCKPQDCGQGRYKTIFLFSASAVFNSKSKSEDVLLYAVRHDNDKKYSLWSIAYHKWQITNMKPDDRGGHFLQHPCPALKKRQLSNNHFTVGNPKLYQRGHLSPADLFRWNEKSANTGNLFINIHPQCGPFNMGSWKTLETAVHCASKNKIKAIVVTGVGGGVIDHIGGPSTRVEVRANFWKLVCYRHGGKVHVAAFIGNNRPVADESQQQKKDTLTPRDQKDVIAIAPEIAAQHNPWLAATQMLAKDKFNLISRYPTPPECEAAMTLDQDQKNNWKSQFNIFNSRRKKREAEGSAFCSTKELNDFKSWMAPFLPKDEDVSKIDPSDDDDDDAGDDGADASNIPSKSCGKRIVGYYASWGNNTISRATISRFTHIVYAFFEVQPDGRVVLGNPDYSTSSNHDEVKGLAEKRLNHLLKVKDQLSNLKVMFAVGGWENSQYFSRIAASQDMKVTFIASVLKVIDDYRLDGVDIDWEYPVAGGAVTGVPDDKPNYVKLMSDLRFALDEKSQKSGRDKFLLTFAGAAGETALRVGYDLPGLLKYADWVNVMSYDFFGPWDSKWGAYTGPPAPLYHNAPKGYSGKYNVNWAIKHYVCKLKSPKQVVMGVPLYGRYWHNVPAKSGEYAMYRMANGVGGKFPGGFVPWKDIKKDWLNNPKYQHTFDQKVKSPFAYGDGTYLGYESPESVKEKVKFAMEKGLGGLMAWEIGQDDQNEMIDLLSQANLCNSVSGVEFKCIPIEDRRWWTFEENEEMAGLCGKSAPLYKGYYPVCDPDDLGYSCCGAFGYCGSGSEYCDCPTCVNYADNPDKMMEEPIKPKSGKVTWHFLNAPDGSRGRCGKDVPKVGDSYATCNPDDNNAHCCSNGGYCGTSSKFCDCKECVDFKKNPNHNFS